MFQYKSTYQRFEILAVVSCNCFVFFHTGRTTRMRVSLLPSSYMLPPGISVANTAAKPRNWATFDTVLTTKNCDKRVRRGLVKDQLHVSLWALIWRRGLRGNCATV